MLNPTDRALDPKCVESLYKALFFYDLDINFHPEVAENYYRKGNILYAIGKKDEAFQCYDKAFTADSTYAPKIGFNIQELCIVDEKNYKILKSFLNHVNRYIKVDTSDLESKEETEIHLSHEVILQKSRVFGNFIQSIKSKISALLTDIDEVVLNYNSFIKNLLEAAPPEGSNIPLDDSNPAITSIELAGDSSVSAFSTPN